MWKKLSVIATIGSLLFGALGIIVEGHEAKGKLDTIFKKED